MRHDFDRKTVRNGFKLFDNKTGDVIAQTVGDRAEALMQMIIDELHLEGSTVNFS